MTCSKEGFGNILLWWKSDRWWGVGGGHSYQMLPSFILLWWHAIIKLVGHSLKSFMLFDVTCCLHSFLLFNRVSQVLASLYYSTRVDLYSHQILLSELVPLKYLQNVQLNYHFHYLLNKRNYALDGFTLTWIACVFTGIFNEKMASSIMNHFVQYMYHFVPKISLCPY